MHSEGSFKFPQEIDSIKVLQLIVISILSSINSHALHEVRSNARFGMQYAIICCLQMLGYIYFIPNRNFEEMRNSILNSNQCIW